MSQIKGLYRGRRGSLTDKKGGIQGGVHHHGARRVKVSGRESSGRVNHVALLRVDELRSSIKVNSVRETAKHTLEIPIFRYSA